MGSSCWGHIWPTLTCIQKFDLSSNNIGADGVKSLGPHLTHLTSIQQLDLSINRIGADGVKLLGTHLAHPHVHPEV